MNGWEVKGVVVRRFVVERGGVGSEKSDGVVWGERRERQRRL